MAHLTTTTELLSVLRRGPDEPTWNLFASRYRPVLVGVARRLGLDDEDAQDAAQQTLLEFVRDFGLGRYDRTRSRLRTWMVGILRHRVVDLHRLRARPTPGAAPRAGGPVADPRVDRVADTVSSDDAIERMWQAEIDRRVLDEALERLRAEPHVQERTLRAFELTVLRDVPIEAAAEACEMTINAVYIARTRIAARLRRLVETLTSTYDEEPAPE